jgi:hypothetical protein
MSMEDRMKPAPWVIAGMLMLWCGACAREEGTALDRDAFYRPPPGTDVRRHVLQDEPGQLEYDNVRVNLLNPEENTIEQVLNPKDSAPPRESVTAISPAVRDAVQVPSSTGDGIASPAPAATQSGDSQVQPQSRPPAGTSSGIAMTIGTIVCEVNGNPIYADKVLASLGKPFAAEAKRRDAASFRKYAQHEINERVRLFIHTELAFAAATKNLDPKEQELAKNATMQWRMRKITEAGGSLERAKAKAAAEGLDFEEMVEEKFRENMVIIYYQKRLLPRTQVRAEDMRNYYYQHLKTRFTEPDQAQFRVIKIDTKKTGGEEPARDKINNLYQKAARGEDFAELARGSNDDPSLMRNGGDVGWVHRGAFRLEELEKAVWQLEPGQVTQPIRIGDSFYIAKLEDRKLGRVKQFEEDAVQKQIKDELQREQLAVLKRRQDDALMREAIVHPMPPNVEPVVEMAMQRYEQWAAAAAPAPPAPVER